MAPPHTSSVKKLEDVELKGQRVFVRVDFNVPLRQIGDQWEVADSTRIEAALPTLRHVLEREGRLIVASHLGRPDGKRVEKYSLEPVGRVLTELLGIPVTLTEDSVGDASKLLSQRLRPGEVLLLENLRFHPGEEANSQEFANRLLDLTDIFVGDAFGTMHRAHASTDLLPRLASTKCAGLLVQRELENLVPLRDAPKRPFTLILGGSKVSDKIAVIESFLPKVDQVLIGGAMAYAFLKARGVSVGRSLCADDQVRFAERVTKAAATRGVPILLPVDHVTVTDFGKPDTKRIEPEENVPADRMAVDIGPKTIDRFRHALSHMETIFWNGPLGAFETPEYSSGTFTVARAIAESRAKKMAGGGDVAAALEASGVASQFDFISTGGGATLEFLEGKELPGLRALAVSSRAG